MNITIYTPQGTYLVPFEKQDAFIKWLNQNAIKVENKVTEVLQPGINTSRHLINE